MCSWKIETLVLKLKQSKVTDYAAFSIDTMKLNLFHLYITTDVDISKLIKLRWIKNKT